MTENLTEKINIIILGLAQGLGFTQTNRRPGGSMDIKCRDWAVTNLDSVFGVINDMGGGILLRY
jgi:hypothetical protein